MIKKTKQELIDMGYTVYSEAYARELIADDTFEGLLYDHGWIWNVVKVGFKGVNDWTLEEVEKYFCEDDMIAFEWQLEEYNEN